MNYHRIKSNVLAFGIAISVYPVHADPASSTALVAYVKEVAISMKEGLKTAHDTLSVSEHVKDLEELRFAKDVAGTGRELRDLAGDFRDVMKLYDKAVKHPYKQINNLKSEVETIKRKAGKLGDGDTINELDDFGALLARADRFAIVREALRCAERKRSLGYSETHAIRATEANTALMTEILLGQEEARLVKEAKEAKQREAMKSVRIKMAPAFERLKQ